MHPSQRWSITTFHMERNTPTCWSLQALDDQVPGKAEKWTHRRRSPCSNPLWSYPDDSLALLCFSFMRGFFFCSSLQSRSITSRFLPSASLSICCLRSLQLKLCSHDPLPNAWSADAHCIPLPVKPEFFSTLVARFIFYFQLLLMYTVIAIQLVLLREDIQDHSNVFVLLHIK